MRLLTRFDIRQSISMREAVEVVKRAFGKLSTGRAGILSIAVLTLCLSAELFLSRGAQAKQLQVKTYTTADGLLRDVVNRIKLEHAAFCGPARMTGCRVSTAMAPSTTRLMTACHIASSTTYFKSLNNTTSLVALCRI